MKNWASGSLNIGFSCSSVQEDDPEPTWQANWDHFLHFRKIWNSMDFAGLLESGMFRIQQEWAFVRSSIRAGIDACLPKMRLVHMEAFLGWRDDPGSRMYRPDGSRDEDTRDDDFLWTYCMDIVLYRDPRYEIVEQAVNRLVSTLHEIGLEMDQIADRNIKRPETDEAETGYHRTSTYLLRIADGKSVDALYAGFGMVALVTEEEGPYPVGNIFGDYAASAWESPSARVVALRRRMLMNYGLLTAAADGLRAYLASILLLPNDWAIHSQHERLRLVVSALAMLKYDATREVIESDDLETYVYGDLYTAWGLAQQNRVLTGLMADADTATTRISETTSHKEERNLGILILLLTVATMGGVPFGSLHVHIGGRGAEDGQRRPSDASLAAPGRGVGGPAIIRLR